MAVITPLGVTNNSVDISKLNDIARDIAPELILQLLNGAEFASHFPVHSDVTSERSFAKMTVGSNWGPYTGSIANAGNEVVFSHRKLRVNVGQDFLAIDPETMRRSPLVEAAVKLTTGGVYHEAIMLAQFAEALLTKINDVTFYYGDTESTATTGEFKAIKAGDGLGKIITTAVAATDPKDQLVPIVTSAWNEGAGWSPVTNEGNVIDGFEAVDNSLPVTQQKKDRTIFCSHANFKKYKNNYKRRHQTDLKSERFDGGVHEFIYLDDTKKGAKIAPATWLGNSNRIIDVVDGAIVVGTDIPTIATSIKVQEIGFLYYYLAKAVFGLQIIDMDAVRINSLS